MISVEEAQERLKELGTSDTAQLEVIYQIIYGFEKYLGELHRSYASLDADAIHFKRRLKVLYTQYLAYERVKFDEKRDKLN